MLSRFQMDRKTLLLAACLTLHTGLAGAISITLCSSENTGALSSPVHYSANSLGYCRDTVCSGYAFSITQGLNCWCSNIAPASSVNPFSCSETCPGYPPEFCGSASGDFSYVQMGNPSGTAGTELPSTSAAPVPAPPPSSARPSSTTVVPVVPDTDTVIQTQTLVNTIVSNNIIYKTTEVVRTSVVTSRPQPPSSSSSTSSRTSAIPTPVTSVELVTVSGAVETFYITATPVPSASSSNAGVSETRSKGLSAGAIAGIVIGAILGLLLSGLLLFFCCRRRRQNSEASGEGNLNRGNSVLSKAGLLRHNSTRAAPLNAPAALGAGLVASRPPRLDTDIPEMSEGPSSAATGPLERRDSRPMFVDQRLNPNALMLHSDHSRTSVGTLQDNHDYSRPLKVVNT